MVQIPRRRTLSCQRTPVVRDPLCGVVREATATPGAFLEPAVLETAFFGAALFGAAFLETAFFGTPPWAVCGWAVDFPTPLAPAFVLAALDRTGAFCCECA